MVEYVAGFCFEGEGKVVLIRKDKPDWQRGKVNGIGGKIEVGENAAMAMRREWEEETGERREDWEQFLVITYPEAVVFFFRSFAAPKSQAKTNETEMVVRGEVATLRFEPEAIPTISCHYGGQQFEFEPIPNLRWIIPMALSGEKGSMRMPL